MSATGSWSAEQAGQPGYVNTNANPFRHTKNHALRDRKLPPSRVVVGTKRDTFIWSPFNKDSQPQMPPCSPLGFFGDSAMMDNLENEAFLSSMSPGSSSPSTPDQLDSSLFFVNEDTPNTHFTKSPSLPPIDGQLKDAAILSAHAASQGSEQQPTREMDATVSNPGSTPNAEIRLLLTELATSRALLASSKDTVLALRERLKQLESALAQAQAQALRKRPRDGRGRFVTTTASVQRKAKRPRVSEINGGCARRRRTQTELLVEAASTCGLCRRSKRACSHWENRW